MASFRSRLDRAQGVRTWPVLRGHLSHWATRSILSHRAAYIPGVPMPRGEQSKGPPSGTCTAHILAGRAVARLVADGIRSTWVLGSLIRLSIKLSETARGGQRRVVWAVGMCPGVCTRRGVGCGVLSCRERVQITLLVLPCVVRCAHRRPRARAGVLESAAHTMIGLNLTRDCFWVTVFRRKRCEHCVEGIAKQTKDR